MDLRTVVEVGLVGLRSEERGTGASRWLCRLGQLGGGWGRVLRGRGYCMICPGSLTFSVEEGRGLETEGRNLWVWRQSERSKLCSMRAFSIVEKWKTVRI